MPGNDRSRPGEGGSSNDQRALIDKSLSDSADSIEPCKRLPRFVLITRRTDSESGVTRFHARFSLASVQRASADARRAGSGIDIYLCEISLVADLSESLDGGDV